MMAAQSIIQPDCWNLDSVSILDSAGEAAPSYVLSNASGSSHVKLSPSAFYLLRAVSLGVSFSQLTAILNAREGSCQVFEEQLRHKYDSLVAELNRLERQPSHGKLPWGFWIRLRLLPKHVTSTLASLLAPLYHPVVAVLFATIMLSAVLLAVHSSFALSLSGPGFLLGAMIFLLVLLAHELGHAAACARFGAQVSDIGLAAYLIYPAFYSDVSAAWKLSRLQRVAVDVGGCYFQGIVTVGLFIANYWLKWEPLHAAIVLSVYSVLFSLNPVFKCDGYWFIADLLGVTNLSHEPRKLFCSALDMLRRKPVQMRQRQSWVTFILVCYSVVTLVVWSYFSWHLLPNLSARAEMLERGIVAVHAEVLRSGYPSFTTLSGLFASTVFVLLSLLMLWNMFKLSLPLLRRLGDKMPVIERSPFKRRTDAKSTETASGR
jgi:putative peptide zinc metalloprotease protein